MAYHCASATVVASCLVWFVGIFAKAGVQVAHTSLLALSCSRTSNICSGTFARLAHIVSCALIVVVTRGAIHKCRSGAQTSGWVTSA